MRNYFRHPADIPIEVVPAANDSGTDLDADSVASSPSLKNLSRGGIAYQSMTALVEGDEVQIIISCVEPTFSAQGIVKWCREENDGFEIGVEFKNADDEFKARMVEQVCHIEQYKQEVLAKQGRELTGEEAAMEWIELYAAVFPMPDLDSEA